MSNSGNENWWPGTQRVTRREFFVDRRGRDGRALPPYIDRGNVALIWAQGSWAGSGRLPGGAEGIRTDFRRGPRDPTKSVISCACQLRLHSRKSGTEASRRISCTRSLRPAVHGVAGARWFPSSKTTRRRYRKREIIQSSRAANASARPMRANARATLVDVFSETRRCDAIPLACAAGH